MESPDMATERVRANKGMADEPRENAGREGRTERKRGGGERPGARIALIEVSFATR